MASVIRGSDNFDSGTVGITLGTAVASTSGTSIDFTGIPAGVKRITVMLDGVSTNGTSIPLLRIGDLGGFETTDYTSIGAGVKYSTADMTRGGSSTDGFRIAVNSHFAANSITAVIILHNMSSNSWVVTGSAILSGEYACPIIGSKTLSGELNQVRLTTTNGTDTLDAGSINISYE